MKSTPAIALFLSLVGLGVAAWTYRDGQARQATTLEKIAALEIRLAANNIQQARANAFTLRQIGRSVAQNRNLARDVEVLSQSQQIITRCDSLTGLLREWQQVLRTEAHEPRTGAVRHPSAATGLPAHRAARLAQALNGYSTFIRTYVPEAPALAPNVTVRPGTTWLYPDGAPLAAAIASLTRLEVETRRLATGALRRQAEKVGSECVCFDKIWPMAVTASNTVAPGAIYEAQLFIAQSGTILRPDMSVGGQPITVGHDGQGVVEFRVSALRPNQPDTLRSHWQGLIVSHSSSNLDDTTFRLDVPYYIVKPLTR